MCGIAGIMTVDGKAPDTRLLDRFAEALGHRGPDGAGRHVADGIGLVHTRLAIIDLETGDQPFTAGSEGREAVLVANGEIYNYIELHDTLEGVDFATRSDCEPPLHLYLRDGLRFADLLRGMYAIAIYDGSLNRLLLARDPFGIKPLYYASTPRGFAFASEPTALIRAGLVEPGIEPSARERLLQLQFTTGRETVFRGIMRVLPGETLMVEAGEITARRQRDPLPQLGPRRTSTADALELLDEVLADSVEIHQRSDVPYGMFLSGGIDSSALLALMGRLNERPVKAFTVGFPDAAVTDERDLARAVARRTGAEHVEVTFDADDFRSLLPRVAAALDDPVADYAALPTFKLGQAARAAGLKVVLTGEGGDELFAGYGRYRRATRPMLLGGRPMRRRGNLDGLTVLRDPDPGWRTDLEAAERIAATRSQWTALQRVQAADCAHWLPNDLLGKVDRCLMAHGVEGRVPFLDIDVADFAFRLPDRLKTRRGRGKWLLRAWLEKAVAESQAFSRKRGFTVPVGEWIAREGERIGSLVAAQPGIGEFCDPGAVRSLFANARGKRGQAAWVLLFYAVWHQVHMLGRPADGDLFEVLAEKG